MAHDEHLSLGKIAKQCNVSRTTVYRWIINGHLRAYSLPSGHFRVRPDDLAEFRKTFGIPDPHDAVGEPESNGQVGGNLFKVLIADDHPDAVLVLRRMVEKILPDANIHESTNGVDTCISVGNLKPEVLLLDIMMPGMDGFAVLQELLRREELAKSRVVVVSAFEPFARIEDLARHNEQVVACLRKPVMFEDLERLLQQVTTDLATRS